MTQEQIHKKKLPDDERRRRKREGIIIIAVIVVVSVLTLVETRVANFGGDFPVSNTILMFILININLILLLLLIFLVLRNLVKLYYDRRHNVAGSRLRTKLLVAFITLTLLPAGILFFFSIRFITNSIAFWFNVPVEQTLENSLVVGREFYNHVENNNRFFLEQVAYQVSTRKLALPENDKKLEKYVSIVQRSFNFDAVEVYSVNSQRLSMAASQNLEGAPLRTISADNLRKESQSLIRTITENSHKGELIRSIGTVPFGVIPMEAKAFVAITVYIPPDLSARMASISRGVEEYKQIKLLKKPVQITYYISLSIVALLVLFCAIWFAFYLAKSITIPIMELAEGTRRVAEGELDFKLMVESDDEIGSLVESFNTMTRDLEESRTQLSLYTEMLKRQNTEIRENQQYITTVLDNVSTGVISMHPDGVITTINKSAEKMLEVNAGEILNRNYKSLLSEQYIELTTAIKDKVSQGKSGMDVPLRVTIGETSRSLMIHFSELKDEFGKIMGIVMVFDDMTELEKAQRMLAWREVARRIAHEVKNPLTPISLSAQRLKRRYSSVIEEPVFEECTRMIIDHVELIRNLVNEFATFARFPKAHLKPCSLGLIIDETLALYREGHTHIRFLPDVPENIPEIHLDRQQIKQAMINLIDNAIASIEGTGDIHVHVSELPDNSGVRLCVADTGKGISNQDKGRLFEPDFSTKKTGMGLGLAIVSSIITDHKARIAVEDNKPVGAKFIIDFPHPAAEKV